MPRGIDRTSLNIVNHEKGTHVNPQEKRALRGVARGDNKRSEQMLERRYYWTAITVSGVKLFFGMIIGHAG